MTVTLVDLPTPVEGPLDVNIIYLAFVYPN